MELMVCVDGVEVSTVEDGEEAVALACRLKAEDAGRLVTIVVG
jgi:hypothetical protein